MEEKIDIVILWVDDNDIKWQEKKVYWQNELGMEIKQQERYRNWDNLHFLFRGIEKYAGWVNHIYLVTDNQKPDWLNLDNKKVTVVDHTSIIEKEFLPTFNSSAIELNIHRIPNLSENFIYFNDDMFIISKVKKTDFFKKGTPRDIGIMNINIPLINQPIYKYIYNNLSIINESFSKHRTLKQKPMNWMNIKRFKQNMKLLLLLPWNGFTGFEDPHLCVSYNKKTFDEVWEKHGFRLVNTVKNKFRNNDDYTQWLMRYWQLASNNFIPLDKPLGKYFGISDDNSIKSCVSAINNQKFKIICVNDNESLVDFKKAKKDVNKSLLQTFPNKSSFEK